MAYKSFSGGYLIRDNKVLLVHHKKFNMWVPAGGHIEENETPDQALIREWKEEVGLDIAILPAHESAFAGDSNETPIPMPFHLGLEREGFDVPRIGYYFYVATISKEQGVKFQVSELFDAKWFSEEDLAELETFDQVRALAKYAIKHYPKIS